MTDKQEQDTAGAKDEAIRLVIEYDDLLRTFTGPIEDITASENAAIDAAYDKMVAAARASIGALVHIPQKPTKKQMEAALDAYLEGVYLTDEQVYASVSKIVSAALTTS